MVFRKVWRWEINTGVSSMTRDRKGSNVDIFKEEKSQSLTRGLTSSSNLGRKKVWSYATNSGGDRVE